MLEKVGYLKFGSQLPTHEEHRLESFDDKGVRVLVPENSKSNGQEDEGGVEGNGEEPQAADGQRESQSSEDQANQGKWEELSWNIWESLKELLLFWTISRPCYLGVSGFGKAYSQHTDGCLFLPCWLSLAVPEEPVKFNFDSQKSCHTLFISS